MASSIQYVKSTFVKTPVFYEKVNFCPNYRITFKVCIKKKCQSDLAVVHQNNI